MTTHTQMLVDAELIGRARAGDTRAVHDLLAALRPGVHRYCTYRLASYFGGRDTAEDAVQETCLAVVTMLGDYSDHGAPFSAWVYAIAANKVADSQRRHRRGAVLVDELPEQVDASLTPEERAIASVELTTVLSLMDQLPRRMREVLLRRASGVTARHVAEDLGMSSGAVDVAHHRALTRVREMVDSSEELSDLFAAFRPLAVQPLSRVA